MTKKINLATVVDSYRLFPDRISKFLKLILAIAIAAIILFEMARKYQSRYGTFFYSPYMPEDENWPTIPSSTNPYHKFCG